jgi:hypothetical protein
MFFNTLKFRRIDIKPFWNLYEYHEVFCGQGVVDPGGRDVSPTSHWLAFSSLLLFKSISETDFSVVSRSV